ncbi:oligosaccharide flippase family protein [Vagococcus entomophilus]|nr:polysaccharide biosynthesis protein [Vagococcus entomophilus]
MTQTTSKLAKGTMILTITSLLVKILSAIYRVPFQNLVGDEGFYVYQQVYPIYGIAMTLALSGIPVFFSKIIAEKDNQLEKEEAIQTFYPLFVVLSLGLFLGTFFGGTCLARLMGDAKLSSLIRMTSFVFLLAPAVATYRGYFQGELQMAPTAISQLWEQVIRVATILLAAFFFTKTRMSLYQMGTWAISGAVLGIGAAYLVLVVYSRKQLKKEIRLPKITKMSKQSFKESVRNVKRFGYEGGVVCIYSAYLILFQLIDSFFIKNLLVRIGMSETQAKVTKGIFDRGQPLVQLGLVVATSLMAVYLPVLTKYYVTKRKEKFLFATSLYLRLTFVVGLAASCGLACILPFVNRGLFGSTAQNTALMIFVFAVFFMSLIQAYQTVFQSYSCLKPVLIAAFLGILGKLVAIVLLTKYFGINGASASTLLGLVCCVSVLHLCFKYSWKVTTFSAFFYLKLLLCIGIMGVILVLYKNGVGYLFGVNLKRMFALCLALMGVLIGATIFLLSILKLKVFSTREWLLIPYGKKLLSLKNRNGEKHEIR